MCKHRSHHRVLGTVVEVEGIPGPLGVFVEEAFGGGFLTLAFCGVDLLNAVLQFQLQLGGMLALQGAQLVQFGLQACTVVLVQLLFVRPQVCLRCPQYGRQRLLQSLDETGFGRRAVVGNVPACCGIQAGQPQGFGQAQHGPLYLALGVQANGHPVRKHGLATAIGQLCQHDDEGVSRLQGRGGCCSSGPGCRCPGPIRPAAEGSR